MRMVPLHPVLEAAFFAAVLVTTIVWSHPVYLAISCACALAYALKLAGRRAGARAAVLVALASAVLFGVLFDRTRMLCAPELLMNPLTPASFVFFATYATFCAMPLAYQLGSEALLARQTRRCAGSALPASEIMYWVHCLTGGSLDGFVNHEEGTVS